MGYSLTSDVQGSTSGVLTADGKDVHVADGTELQFAVAPIGSAGTLRWEISGDYLLQPG